MSNKLETKALTASLDAIGWELVLSQRGLHQAGRRPTGEWDIGLRWRDLFASSQAELLAKVMANNERIEHEHAKQLKDIRASVRSAKRTLILEEKEYQRRATSPQAFVKRPDLPTPPRRRANDLAKARIRAAYRRFLTDQPDEKETQSKTHEALPGDSWPSPHTMVETIWG